MQKVMLLWMLSLLFSVGSLAQTKGGVKVNKHVAVNTNDTCLAKHFTVSDYDSLKCTDFVKYAFAYHKNRVGLYNIIKKKSVTGLDFTKMECSSATTAKGTKMYVFACLTVDGREGILFVNGKDDSTMFVGAAGKKK